MKRKFRVTVDGEAFDVEVEEITEAGAPPRVEIAPKMAPPARVQEGSRPITRSGEMGEVVAPLPGVISEIRVAEGDNVEAGSVLLVLEAMKMENEIYAPVEGIVSKVYVEVGQQVGRGDRLIVIS